MDKVGKRKYVIVDVETTGLSHKQNRIIEIGAIRVENGKIVDRFDSLIHTVTAIPPFISQFTGITQIEYDNNAIDPSEGFKKFHDYIGKLPFVAHNVYFDFNFVNSEFVRYGLPIIRAPRLCTLQLARTVFPTLSNYKLTTIKEFLELDYRSHRGLDDVLVCFEILKRASALEFDNRTVYPPRI